MDAVGGVGEVGVGGVEAIKRLAVHQRGQNRSTNSRRSCAFGVGGGVLRRATSTERAGRSHAAATTPEGKVGIYICASGRANRDDFTMARHTRKWRGRLSSQGSGLVYRRSKLESCRPMNEIYMPFATGGDNESTVGTLSLKPTTEDLATI